MKILRKEPREILEEQERITHYDVSAGAYCEAVLAQLVEVDLDEIVLNYIRWQITPLVSTREYKPFTQFLEEQLKENDAQQSTANEKS